MNIHRVFIPKAAELPLDAGRHQSRGIGIPSSRRTEKLAVHAQRTALVAPINMIFTGCSMPVSHPMVDLSNQFFTKKVGEAEPEATWWEIAIRGSLTVAALLTIFFAPALYSAWLKVHRQRPAGGTDQALLPVIPVS